MNFTKKELELLLEFFDAINNEDFQDDSGNIVDDNGVIDAELVALRAKLNSAIEGR